MDNITKILGQLADAGVEVYSSEDRLKARSLKGNLSPDLLNLIKLNKPEIIAHLDRQSETQSNVRRPVVTPCHRQSKYLKTSFAQQRMWFMAQMNVNATHYNMPSALRLSGQFNVDIAQQAFTQIINRHESLRTVYVDRENGPFQVIQENHDFNINILDLSHSKSYDLKHQIKSAINKDALKPFDLSKDLMLRVSYLYLTDETGIMLFNMHHIASDGWSIGILIKEFVKIYTDLYQGGQAVLEPLPIQYADYANWQRKWVTGSVLENQLNYWDKQLERLPQVHSLPLDFDRPRVQKFEGSSHQFSVSQEIFKKLNDLAVSNQVTLFMVIHAAFSILVARYANNNDVVIGTPVANRLQQELEPLIGFFVNTLVLRVDCSNNPRFIDFLYQVKNIHVDAQTNQDVPFELLVDRINPDRSASYQALFQIMLNMNNAKTSEFNLPDVVVKPEISDFTEAVKFDLVLIANVSEEKTSDEGINFTFQFNSELFELQTINNFSESLKELLINIANDPTERLSELNLLSDAERDKLLYKLNYTYKHYSKHLCVHQLFELQVSKTPDSEALTFNDQSISYSELNTRANQLAHMLYKLGVENENKVGLCFDRCFDFIIAQLAVFKLGATIVPMGADQPRERLKHISTDSGISLILTHTCYVDLTLGMSSKILLMDEVEFCKQLHKQPQNNPKNKNICSSAVAYIIYTSGSTGAPKGVLNTHMGLNNLSHWHINQFKVNKDTIGTHLASIGFDAAVWEVWPYLTAGAKVLLITDSVRRSPKDLLNKFNQHAVTHSFIPTALFESAYEYFDSTDNKSLEYIFVGGEKLNKQGFVYCQAKLINNYGPTEASVVTTFHETNPRMSNESPALGRPIDNVKIYIMNAERSLVPFKTNGELYIAGDGLAKGYQNLPQLTTDKFIQHTFCDGHTERLYQSGDLVRYTEDGLLEFIGRTDKQIKLRGFRIELGEVEFNLNKIAHVKNSVVLIEKDSHGKKQLSAYVVLDESFKHITAVEERIKNELKEFLPDYMVPSYLTVLDKFPLTLNGKIDNNKLTQMTKSISAVGHIPAISELEKKLVEVLSEELQLLTKDISMGANFFNLGGHSLSLLNVINKLNHAGFEISLKLFYECNNLREICNKSLKNDSSILTDIIIKLNQQKRGSPLILLHSMTGRVDFFKELATLLESSTAVIGVQAPFLSNHNFSFDNLDELTDLYVKAIIKHQPQGPYRLGGWSIGGLFAQKIIEKLNAFGLEVNYFVAIDSFMKSPTFKQHSQIAALHEAMSFVGDYNDVEVNDLLKQVEDKSFNKKLIFAAKSIAAKQSDDFDEDYLVRSLKFIVDVFKAPIETSKQTVSKLSRLFIATENNNKDILLKAWHNSLQATTEYQEIKGTHTSILKDQGIKQISDQIALDIKCLK